MTFEELAGCCIETFEGLDLAQMDELLEKNVPVEALQFFFSYTDQLQSEKVRLDTGRLPELMLLGYLIRALEERLQPDRTLPLALQSEAPGLAGPALDG